MLSLADLKIVHLRFQSVAARDLPVPFAGPILRGALLERLPPAVKFLSGKTASFALAPPEAIAAGPCPWELKLFGSAIALWPEFVRAAIGMGERGIGRDRVRFPLERVESLEPGGRSRRLAGPGDPAGVLEFTALDVARGSVGESPAGASRVELHLRTPLRLQEQGRISDSLAPGTILRAALRRLRSLAGSTGEGRLGFVEGDLEEAAAALELVEARTRWLEAGHWSRRQGLDFPLGGLVGRAVYQISPLAAPEAFLPILRAGAFAQLGKSTAFGLGVIDLVESHAVETVETRALSVGRC